MVSLSDILAASIDNGTQADLKGLACCAYAGKSLYKRIEMLASWILTNEAMWAEVQNIDRPLYLDIEHTQKNPNVTAHDYLLVFKEYMRIWASRKNQGTPEADWNLMLREFGDMLSDEQFVKDLSSGRPS